MSSDQALAAATAAIAEAIPAGSSPDALLIAARCRALMAGYDARWAGGEWQALALEQTVHLPLVNPETGRSSRTFTHAGKFDGIAQGYGRTVLLEHKTTSEDIADPHATYWRRLTIDSQVSKYLLSAWQSGVRLDGTLYDVIRKPAIRPKRLAAIDVKGIVHTATYCGLPVGEESFADVKQGRLDSEDAHLFELRMTAELLEQPDRYYQRRNVPRLDGEVLEYAQELWQIGQAILDARNARSHFRNSDACVSYGRPCEYLGVCGGEEELEGNDRWRRAAEVHSELDFANSGTDGGRSILTNSRLKVFQTCRRKHFLRYEEGWRRVDEEEAEALYLGSTLHLALEAWWANQGENHGSSSSAASAVAQQPADAHA